jgi:hypothetical protein
MHISDIELEHPCYGTLPRLQIRDWDTLRLFRPCVPGRRSCLLATPKISRLTYAGKPIENLSSLDAGGDSPGFQEIRRLSEWPCCWFCRSSHVGGVIVRRIHLCLCKHAQPRCSPGGDGLEASGRAWYECCNRVDAIVDLTQTNVQANHQTVSMALPVWE